MRIEDIFPEGIWMGEEEFLIACPICGDPPRSHNHMYLNPTKQKFYCHYCGEGGSLSYLIRRYGGGEKIELSKPEEKKEKTDLLDFSEFHHITGAYSLFDRMALQYLQKRSIGMLEIKHYDLRYSDSGKFYGRVIVPIKEDEKVVCFTGRSFIRKIKPKYLYPKLGETILTSANAIFGYSYAFWRQSGLYVLVEGVFDAMAVNRRDKFCLAMALLSKNMSESQLYKLLKLRGRDFYIMLDADAKEEALKIARALEQWERRAYLCLLDKGDPASISRDDFVYVLEHAERYSMKLDLEVGFGN